MESFRGERPFSNANPARSFYLHHGATAAFLTALDNGCPLCQRLWARLSDEERAIVSRHELQPYEDNRGLFRYSVTRPLANDEYEVALWCRFERDGVDYNKFGTLDLVPTSSERYRALKLCV